MTPESQRLVRDSFAKVAPIAPMAAMMFYDRLFAIDPNLRSLFKGDMEEQGRKLMSMILFPEEDRLPLRAESAER